MGNDAAISVAGGHKHKEIMQQGHDTNGSTSVDSARMCTSERCIDREEGFASQFYSTCLRGLQQLCRQEQEGYAPRARSHLLKEELGKLYLWGESFSPGELDKALDEYEEIRDNVLDLLVNLGELIIRALRASTTVAHAGQIHEIESSVERARFIASDVDGQEDVDVLPGDKNCPDRDDSSDDDMADLCEDVAFTIKCLTELGPSLQQNLASAGRPVPPVSESILSLPCPSGPAGFYVSLVRDKFKQASKELIERLGEANWQRHVRVRNIMKDLENNPAKGQDTSRSVFQPDTTFHDSGIGTSVPAWTQYAPSHTSFRTSNPGGGPSSLRVPPAPVEAADGKPFQCYLCGEMLSTVRTRTQWKMHVFSDLMPYLCTFDGCQHKLKSFQSRSSWADHEFQEHRLNRYWACPGCSKKSCSIPDWEHHLDDVHNLKFFGPDLLEARKNACHISPKRAEEEQCPLCQVVLGKPRRAFVKHVSRHMEDIALMALPSNAEEDSETDSTHTDHASVKENNTSKDNFGDNNGNTVYSERYDTGDGLVPGSPEVERPFVQHSGSPDDSPPVERSPTPESTLTSKDMEEIRYAVLTGSMGGLNHAQYDPVNNKSPEAPHLESLDRVEQILQQAAVSIDEKSQGRSPQGAVRRRRHLTSASEEREHAREVRRVSACKDCRRRKIKCTHSLAGNSVNREGPTGPPSSPTSSTVPTINSLSHTAQMFTSTPLGEPITNPFVMDPSKISLSIDDRGNRLRPPVPLFPQVNIEPPSDNDDDEVFPQVNIEPPSDNDDDEVFPQVNIEPPSDNDDDEGKSPQPSKGIGEWGTPDEEDGESRDKTASLKRILRRREENNDNKDKPTCPTCGRIFLRSDALRRHLKRYNH